MHLTLGKIKLDDLPCHPASIPSIIPHDFMEAENKNSRRILRESADMKLGAGEQADEPTKGIWMFFGSSQSEPVDPIGLGKGAWNVTASQV